MATDGVKIIDGDVARDTYNGIMDLYDNGSSIETIREKIPFVRTDLGGDTDFYHEIFVTAYALAFWEIGEITEHILDEVKSVISAKVGVKVWTEECSAKEGKKRQKELDKLLHKISFPNPKIRKRKKYKKILRIYFQPDDLLAVQLSDNYYYAVICAKVAHQRGQCTYALVATTYKGTTKPTVEDLQNCCIVGRRIASGFDMKTTISHQPAVDQIWAYYQKDINFFFGLPYYLAVHKDMANFKDKFEVVGKLKIKESFKKDGSYWYSSSFDNFEDMLGDLDNYIKVWKIQKFPVTLLCER